MRRQLYGIFSVRDWKTRLIFWSGALAVGLIAALFAVASNQVMALHDSVIAKSRWWAFLVSPLAMIAVVTGTRLLFPGTQGSGIPQAIVALRSDDDGLRRRMLSLRIAAGKLLLTLMGFLGGASIGREGPTVHIGASIMYSLGRFTKFPTHYIRHGLIMVGGAAGIAAAFNTPIAGIIFAIEEMARFYEERATGLLLVAVIIAGLAALAILGNYTYFGVSSATLTGLHSWVAVVLCGIVGGLLGGGFSRLLLEGIKLLRPLMVKHWLAVAAACGLTIAIFGLLSDGSSYGTGYAQARHILLGHATVDWAFPFYKIGATMSSYLSGAPGGIFSPSLSIGAGLGNDLSVFMPYVSPGAVVLLGMVGYFTGVVQTPLTASVIVMEMVNDQSMVFPIITTAFIALGVSKLVCKTPIYWALAEEFLAEKRVKTGTTLIPKQDP
ncbi:MAG TPA: chloride channel protein [Gammaproteobacteria bacterium]|jgi:H+/Cl- antiporter ClcA